MTDRATAPPASRRPDGGFTLVELLMIVAIVSVVVVGLSATLVVFLRNSDDLPDKMAASHSAQLTTRYLTSDLHSVEQGGATTSGFTTVCGIVPDVLALSWTDLSVTPSTRYDAIYYRSGTDLVRTLCINGAVSQSVDVAHGVATASATLTGPDLELSITTVGTDADPSGFTYSIFGTRRS